MDSSSTAQAPPQQTISSKRVGWTSFDSPVHSQLPSTNTYATSQASSDEVANRGWSDFQTRNRSVDSNAITSAASETMSSQSALSGSHRTSSNLTQSLSQTQHPQTNIQLPFIRSEHESNITFSKQSHPSNFTNTPKVSTTDIPTTSAISYPVSNQTVSANANDRPRVPSKEDSDYAVSKPLSETGSDYQDPWCITEEQRQYYTNQFTSMQPDIKEKIDGITAKNFFTKSKLPIVELSHVWELSDMDKDGRLSLDEFCTAFHLVVARMNKYDLPSQLPQALIPTLIDIRSEGDNSKVVDSPLNEKRVEQWETFSDRTASSTTLANFDQVPDSNQDVHHPVAQRMTPSRHQEHWSKMESGNLKVETLDEESTTSSPRTQTKKHHSMTNPYEYLKNDFSGMDGSDEETYGARKASASSSSSSDSPRSRIARNVDENVFNRTIRIKVAAQDRSSDDDKPLNDHEHSDHEHSDWASRPLRPRSTSNSSEDSVVLPSIVAPKPPPRPQIHVQAPTVSPLPKPRTTGSKPRHKSEVSTFPQETEKRLDGPTPPPRPTMISKQHSAPAEQESFADFSNFPPTAAPENADSQTAVTETSKAKNKKPKSTKKKEKRGNGSSRAEQIAEKSIPVSRLQKETVKSAEREGNVSDVINASSKKAPTKPPRSRVMSADMIRNERVMASLATSKSVDTSILPAPKQNYSRKKLTLKSSIRELKNHNTQLSRLNADLQQQLKDVMETRITVEMAIHQMRPFSQ